MKNYRTEIDGLRALAVSAVILFHAGSSFASGGYVGVDVFFVISGYLITGILSRDISEGKFSYTKFYIRRARRILPALYLVILATIPFAWVWMFPDAFRHYSQSMLGAVFSYANFHFWSQSGYFQSDVELEPLLHIWSLAVEEQFYLVLPPVLLLLFRSVGSKSVVLVLAAIAAASLGVCEFLVRTDPEANFYLLPSRIWEFLAGGLLSFLPGGQTSKRNALAEILAVVGLGMIVAATCLFDSKTPFPSMLTLLPVLGTCLVLFYGVNGTFVAWLLQRRFAVFIGTISYSAYLWH